MDVEEDVIGADLIIHGQLARILRIQAIKLSRIDGLRQGDGIRLIGGQDRDAVLGEVRVDAAQTDRVRIPVVGVLLVGDDVVNLEAGHAEGTGADVGLRVDRPGALVIRQLGLDRAEGGEAAQLEEVRAGRVQGDGQGAGRVVGDDVQAAGTVAVDDVEQEAVGRAELLISRTVPALDDVAGIEVAAVGPLEALAQGEGVDGAIFRDGVALGELRLFGDNAIGDAGAHQASESQTDQVGAAGRGVEGRVHRLRRAAAVHHGDDLAVSQGGHAQRHHHDKREHESKKLFHWIFLL